MAFIQQFQPFAAAASTDLRRWLPQATSAPPQLKRCSLLSVASQRHQPFRMGEALRLRETAGGEIRASVSGSCTTHAIYCNGSDPPTDRWGSRMHARNLNGHVGNAPAVRKNVDARRCRRALKHSSWRLTERSGCSCGRQGGKVSVATITPLQAADLAREPGRLQLHEALPATLQALLSHVRLGSREREQGAVIFRAGGCQRGARRRCSPRVPGAARPPGTGHISDRFSP